MLGHERLLDLREEPRCFATPPGLGEQDGQIERAEDALREAALREQVVSRGGQKRLGLLPLAELGPDPPFEPVDPDLLAFVSHVRVLAPGLLENASRPARLSDLRQGQGEAEAGAHGEPWARRRIEGFPPALQEADRQVSPVLLQAEEAAEHQRSALLRRLAALREDAGRMEEQPRGLVEPALLPADETQRPAELPAVARLQRPGQEVGGSDQGLLGQGQVAQQAVGIPLEYQGPRAQGRVDRLRRFLAPATGGHLQGDLRQRYRALRVLELCLLARLHEVLRSELGLLQEGLRPQVPRPAHEISQERLGLGLPA